MYRDQYHPKVKKDLKKLDRGIRQAIETIHIPAILENPGIGEDLVSDLSGMYAYHFTVVKQAYRIAYMVDEDAQTVFVMMIGKRENFYTILKRRL
jgi:addiction module RelE/StbE family toxin